VKLTYKYLGNSTTYDDELTKLGKQWFGDKYIGTFSYDLLPQLSNGQSAIINVDKSTLGGSHWVSVIMINNLIFGYDSFGRNINKLIPGLEINIVNDTIDSEQNPYTQFDCGARCMAWLFCVYNFGIKRSLLI
jgi:hypothetical protein